MFVYVCYFSGSGNLYRAWPTYKCSRLDAKIQQKFSIISAFPFHLTSNVFIIQEGPKTLQIINAAAGNILEISLTLKLRFIAVYDMRQLNVAGQLA